MPDSGHKLSDAAALAQGFLLAEGGSLSMKKLAQYLGKDELATTVALDEVAAALEGSGIALVRTKTEVSLATSARVAEPLKKAFEEALARDIGNAGLEVLAVVLYRGASTRARIDYIRGVNTSSTIRLLLSRGLLERIQNPSDAREYLYRPTAELLAHLGARSEKELPDYDTIRAELDAFETTAPAAFESHDSGESETADE